MGNNITTILGRKQIIMTWVSNPNFGELQTCDLVLRTYESQIHCKGLKLYENLKPSNEQKKCIRFMLLNFIIYLHNYGHN
jgi:hypothetical protein